MALNWQKPRYRLPWRSSNVNASNAPDAQAAYESQMALWGALLGGSNLVLHGAGWLEGGLTASLEKFMIDIEMLQTFAALFRPEPAARCEPAPDAAQVSDRRGYQAWRDAGALDAAQRAHRAWKRRLAEFQPPPLEAATREALDAFVARRTAAGGADLED